MAVRIYVLESLLVRTTDLVERAIDAGQGTPAARLLAALEEYAIEASIAKVAGSETADYVVDENVQIHGGNGFVSDYPAERRYRDARVNRIFEGTNEINRLLIAGLLARRAAKGDIGLIAAAKRLADEVTGPLMGDGGDDAPLAAARRTVTGLKKAALLVLGTAMQRFGEKLADEQEALMLTADLVIDAFGAESALLRAERARSDGARHGDDPRSDGLHRGRRRRAARRDGRARSGRGPHRRRHAPGHAVGAAAAAQERAGRHGGAAPDHRRARHGRGRRGLRLAIATNRNSKLHIPNASCKVRLWSLEFEVWSSGDLNPCAGGPARWY